MALDLDQLIALMESRGKNTAVDPKTMKDYEESKFLKEQETRSNRRIAENAGINPDAVKGMSRREVQDLVSKFRTAKYNKESGALKETYGTSERGLVDKLKGNPLFAKDKEQRRMAFSNPDALSAAADEAEALYFPRGRKFSDRPNASDIGDRIDILRSMAATGPKSADVTAQKAATRLPEFDKLTMQESEDKILKHLERGEMSAAEATTLRSALKPKAALEEEQIIARLRPGAEADAWASDVTNAANNLMAPLMDATKLQLSEIRARKRLATEIQKRGVDFMSDPMAMQANPRALPLSKIQNNPNAPATMVNPQGQKPNQLDMAEEDLVNNADIPQDMDSIPPPVESPYDLLRKRTKDKYNIDEMF